MTGFSAYAGDSSMYEVHKYVDSSPLPFIRKCSLGQSLTLITQGSWSSTHTKSDTSSPKSVCQPPLSASPNLTSAPSPRLLKVCSHIAVPPRQLLSRLRALNTRASAQTRPAHLLQTLPVPTSQISHNHSSQTLPSPWAKAATLLAAAVPLCPRLLQLLRQALLVLHLVLPREQSLLRPSRRARSSVQALEFCSVSSWLLHLLSRRYALILDTTLFGRQYNVKIYVQEHLGSSS